MQSGGTATISGFDASSGFDAPDAGTLALPAFLLSDSLLPPWPPPPEVYRRTEHLSASGPSGSSEAASSPSPSSSAGYCPGPKQQSSSRKYFATAADMYDDCRAASAQEAPPTRKAPARQEATSAPSGSRGARPKAAPSAAVLRGRDLADAGEGVGGLLTLMLRGLPAWYNQRQVLQKFRNCGFSHTYDFFYLPMDLRNPKNRGFAFVNFKSSTSAEAFYAFFNGRLFCEDAGKALEVMPSDMQGYEAISEHFNGIDWGDRPASCQPLFLPGSHPALDRLSDSGATPGKGDGKAAEAPARASGSAAKELATAGFACCPSVQTTEHADAAIALAVRAGVVRVQQQQAQDLQQRVEAQVAKELASMQDAQVTLCAQLNSARMEAEEKRTRVQQLQRMLQEQREEHRQLQQSEQVLQLELQRLAEQERTRCELMQLQRLQWFNELQVSPPAMQQLQLLVAQSVVQQQQLEQKQPQQPTLQELRLRQPQPGVLRL